MKLYKGNVQILQRKSDKSLYDPEISTFESDTIYDQSDAEGFIKLNALRLKLLKSEDNFTPGNDFWERDALSVFNRRHAIVIGPTPPGTGVILETTFNTSSKSTSPTSLFFPLFQFCLFQHQ